MKHELSASLLVAFGLLGCTTESTQGGAHRPQPDAALSNADASDEQTDARSCLPIPCPSAAAWDPEACSCRKTCDIVGLVTTHASPDAVDCGQVRQDAEQAVREQAQRCVLDAVAAGKPFNLIVWPEADDSIVADAYASAGGAALVSVFHYESGTSFGDGSIGEQTCRSLQVRSGCTVSTDSLCLECKDAVENSIACSSREASPTQACRGVGNYEVGKEGGYQPCCDGLREVFQQSPGYTGDNGAQKVCGYAPLRVYACIEGRCGDGRCEEPEAVACGCTLDCPSAAWAPKR